MSSVILFNPEDKQKGFSHFDLGLNADESSQLENAQVAHNATYDNFGKLDRLQGDLENFYHQLGNADEVSRRQAALTARTINRVVARSGMQTAWITVRASKPTPEFDRPRWHTDGYYYLPYEGEQHKAVFAIKGAHTLLNALPANKRPAFMEWQRTAHDETTARAQREAMIDPSQTKSTPQGKGTWMIAGPEHSSVHSEPPIHEDRIFVSVLPGSKGQIECLRQNWNKPEEPVICGPNVSRTTAPAVMGTGHTL
ncbi:MAG: hypothetical protein AB7L92_01990 [Alphaproteobacteria bacterium]